MLPRPLRLFWDTSPPGGVVLSSFRSRDPEEGGGPGGRGVGGGQEEEEEEEEDDEVRRGRWEVGGVYISETLHLSVSVSLHLFLPQLLPRLSLVSTCLPAAGSPGVSVVLCRSVTQDLPAETCPVPARSVCLAVLRVSGPLRLCPSVPVSLGLVSRSLSPSLFLFGGEGFVSTVTRSSDSGTGEGTP